jgi:hypothetical protein
VGFSLSASRPRPARAAAAAASLSLALVLAGCSQPASRPPAGARTTAASGTTSAATAPAPPVDAKDVVWPYYAELNAVSHPLYRNPRELTIRSTGTAAVLATVRPPAPFQTFGLLTGGTVADQWVVGAQPWHPVRVDDNSAQPVTLFSLTFNPVTKRTTLARLPVPPVHALPFMPGGPDQPGQDQLAAASLSPDGTRLAAVVITPAAFEVRVYPVAGGAVRTWSQPLPASQDDEAQFSLTWLAGSRTLAVGLKIGYDVPLGPANVTFLDTSGPGGALAAAGRRITLTFPAAKPPTSFQGPYPPNRCLSAPVVTSDGQTVLCSGLAVTPDNAAGATAVGIWLFSAATGKLTATWNPHVICCALNGYEFPDLYWVSPGGQLVIASGMSTAHSGEQLFLRQADGQLRQLPWQGIYTIPLQDPPVEPPIAW